MVSAGEASRVSHAANALRALAAHGTNFQSFGMGAGALQVAGTELIVDCRDLAVIGIFDYPDFNLKLAETAKALKIPVLFYISPKVWAWRAGQVPRIGSLVSHMVVLFPFEVEIYQRAGIKGWLPARFECSGNTW